MNTVGDFESQDFFDLLESLSNGTDMEVYFAFRLEKILNVVRRNYYKLFLFDDC